MRTSPAPTSPTPTSRARTSRARTSRARTSRARTSRARIAELARPRPVITPPFTILSFADPASPDATCTTGISGQITITTRPADLRTLHATFTTLADYAATTDDTATLIKDTAANWERQVHQDR